MYYFLQSIKKIYLCNVVVKPIGKKKKKYKGIRETKKVKSNLFKVLARLLRY